MKIKHYCRTKINTVIETIVPFLLSALGKHILTSKNHYQQLMNFTSLWHEVLFPYRVFFGGVSFIENKRSLYPFLELSVLSIR